MATSERPVQNSLFGGTEPARAERGEFRSPQANGYAAPPGTGPAGETCGTCSHCSVRVHTSAGRNRKFYKCGVMVQTWSFCRSTDVLASSPACRLFAPGEPHVSTVRNIHHREWKD